jgi:hypothetical protein
MPSPNCRIPVSVVPSDRFESLDGDQGIAFIPCSIPEGNTVMLEGTIKVLIRPNTLPPVAGAVFCQEELISIQAIMPWLDRKLPSFEHTKAVQLQFPCELRKIDCLSSLGQGSTSRMTWEVCVERIQPAKVTH